MMNSPSVLRQICTLLPGLLILSAVTNMAVLVSPLFMMQVLDRVIPTGNLSTLVLLLALVLMALATNALVDLGRDLSIGRIGRWVHGLTMRQILAAPSGSESIAVEDAAILRGYFAGAAPAAVLALPWMPLFLFALYLLHPYFLGLVVVASLLFLGVRQLALSLTMDAERRSGALLSEIKRTLGVLFETVPKIGARGLSGNLKSTVGQALHQLSAEEEQASFPAAASKSLQGMLRAAVQISALALGAFLVVQNELSAGAMIGASIITSKTVSTFEGALNGVSPTGAAIAALRRLDQYLGLPELMRTEVENLSGALRADGLIFPRGGGAPPRLDRISFALPAGECLAIVGDSGSGKTTLLQALAGLAPAPIGAVFLDSSDIRTLGKDTARKNLGFLPQQACLLEGTLAQNISCFTPDRDDSKIIGAAKKAGVHGLISALPDAYETDIALHPYLLSAGQKQRVALARAIYQTPKYLFLDEPNALLDAQGERQLGEALSDLKGQGTTIVMVLHRSGVMGLTDKILHLDQGRVVDFGSRPEVLGRKSQGQRKLSLPVTTAALHELTEWVSNQFLRASDEEFRMKTILVANEMFNVICQNGPNDQPRTLTVQFAFLDPKTCEIQIAEPRLVDMNGKLVKIRKLVDQPLQAMDAVPDDEIALAMVLQLTQSFDVQTQKHSSIYAAKICADAPLNQPLLH